MDPLSRNEVFGRWSPVGSPWSAWAKPVLFTRVGELPPAAAAPDEPLPELAVAPEFRRSRALVVELPGEQAARVAPALRRAGWQLVPSWNSTWGTPAMVDTSRLAASLAPLARRLEEFPLDDGAPPAFLLDAGRFPKRPPSPGDFDNRSIMLPQDFPSATRLRAGGIDEVVAITASDASIAEDLAHVLLAWQQGGVALRQLPQDGTPAHDLALRPPSGFRRCWYRFIALIGMRRANVGGFGAQVPIPAKRSGYYG